MRGLARAVKLAIVKLVYSRAVYARLRNFEYDRTGATDLLPLRDVYYLALERA